MTVAGQPAPKKPILTVKQQINHLRDRGITFELCSESEAARILSERDHYFRLAAYRVLFPKRVGGDRDGQYAKLDFGHLVDLAAIDQELRNFLLPLTLEVESSAKTALVRRITDTPSENGYSIFSDYLSSLNHSDLTRRRSEIEHLENDVYLGPLVGSYPLDKMPAWVFLELASFGAFADFYLFCAKRWNNSSMKSEHYLLRRTKSLRNASAHSSAIINGMGADSPHTSIRTPPEVADALEEIGINRRARRSKMKNPRIQQIVVFAFAYSHFVPTEKRLETANRLDALERRVLLNAGWYSGNTVIGSSYSFISKALDGLLSQRCRNFEGH